MNDTGSWEPLGFFVTGYLCIYRRFACYQDFHSLQFFTNYRKVRLWTSALWNCPPSSSYSFRARITVPSKLVSEIVTCTTKIILVIYKPHSPLLLPYEMFGSWIYNYLCNQCLSPLMLWVRISIRARCTTLCEKVCQWLVTCGWFPPGPPVSSTNKTDRHDITEILLKVALIT